MKAIPNDLLIDQLEMQVEMQMKEAIHDFQNRADEILLKPSTNGGWSVVQCLEHLNSYGRYYLPLLEDQLKTAQIQANNPLFSSTKLGAYFTRLMDPSRSKMKFKAFKGHLPARHLEAHRVIAEFIHQQETLLRCLEAARQRDLNSIRIPVSIFPWIKLRIGDVLQFLIVHNERHIRQAKRNFL